MRKELVARTICPVCLKHEAVENPLTLDVREEDGREVISGTLTCGRCRKTYEIANGIAELLTDEMAREKKSMTKAWEDLASREKWLAPVPEYLDALPFPAALQFAPDDTITWDRHCRNYFQVLSCLDVQNKDVLDLGAGRCWSSKYLALRGARTVATDLMSHDTLGLGAASTILERNPIFFERVCCDMNCLPFASQSFDIVFVSGSLHHTPDLALACAEIGRVCRDGGCFAMTNEPCNRWRGAEAGDDADDTSEHNYRTWRQLLSLRRAGFSRMQILPDAYFHRRNDYCYSPFFDRLSRLTQCAYFLKPLILGGVLLLTARRRLRNPRQPKNRPGAQGCE